MQSSGIYTWTLPTEINSVGIAEKCSSGRPSYFDDLDGRSVPKTLLDLILMMRLGQCQDWSEQFSQSTSRPSQFLTTALTSLKPRGEFVRHSLRGNTAFTVAIMDFIMKVIVQYQGTHLVVIGGFNAHFVQYSRFGFAQLPQSNWIR
jgi:hypothetical protein